jgi:hypothetical protein
VLFVGGALFGYTQILPIMFKFFTSYDTDWVKSAWTMHEVFKLTTSMFLAFGVAFELPVFVFLLAVAGIVDAPTLFRGTRYAVLVIFIAAAMITPSPDWVSQCLLGVPMVSLYLIGVGVAYMFGPEAPERGEPAPVPRRAGRLALLAQPHHALGVDQDEQPCASTVTSPAWRTRARLDTLRPSTVSTHASNSSGRRAASGACTRARACASDRRCPSGCSRC